MQRKFKVALALCLTMVMGAFCVGCSAQSSDGAADDMYVTMDYLTENLDNVIVVDARSADAYAAAHIPGAINLEWAAFSNMKAQIGEDGWGELNDPAENSKTAAAAGIDGTKPVVVYTDVAAGWGEDGRIMWTLREAGIADVHVLDGGWRKWVGGGNEIESAPVTLDPVEAPADIQDCDPLEQVDDAFVTEHLNDAIIIDTRAQPEYDAQMVVYEARMGRIPGAVSVPNVSLFNQDSTVKTADELGQIFTDAGLADKDALIITYCTGGVRGANVAEVLEHNGYTNVKVYTAGFAEWAGNKANKVEAEAPVPAE